MNDGETPFRHLGKGKTDAVYSGPQTAMLDVFANPRPGRRYNIQFETSEFTSLCPVTGQPDFAEIEINYVPGELCLESKSLKLYLLAYRQHPAFAETVTNQILDDLVAVCRPLWMEVKTRFKPRGGIGLNVTAVHEEASHG
jgi:7-cyano-7-deazaguanine reductase